jgi:integrase
MLMTKEKTIFKQGKSYTVRDVVVEYWGSDSFLKLGAASQKDYYDCLMVINDDIGDTSMKRLSVSLMQQCYITWLKRGEYVKTGKLSIYRANKIAAIMSILINWSKKNGINIENPMPLVEKTPNPQRTVMWEPEQVNQFLTTAYSEWKWRSIGLIVQMAYEWGQRVGDMRMLTWAAINFDKKRCDLVQSKRGAEVHLPISDTLMHVLKQQHETFGFQVLVAPQVQPSDGSYKPYSKEMLHVHVNAVLEAAELPNYLTAMDMRRTAITEMVEAGVDITQIKQVSGHTNINSLTPYIKHTYTGASEALAQRQAFKDKK